MSKLRTLTKMFAVWMLLGSGALAAVSFLDQDKPESAARPTVIAAAETSLPCKEQAWPMIDRKCLKWTAPPKTDAPVANATPAPEPTRVAVAIAVDAAPPEAMHADVVAPGAPGPVAAEPNKVEPAKPEPVRVEAAKPEPKPEPKSEAKPEPVREQPAFRASLDTLPSVPRAQRPAPVARPANEIHVMSRSANGTPRAIVVRPTNAQDALYYAARREAAVGPFGLRR